ncbi:MAG: hypothetical protein MRZ90_06690, partial [Candidatus Gastranaerophilales bacterium]|nr:hypothetical protein [Candidatus Gastranaerophilales bacterium]
DKTIIKNFIDKPNADPEVLKAQVSLIDTAINNGILKDDDETIIKKFIDEPSDVSSVLNEQGKLVATYFQEFKGENEECADIKAKIQLAKKICKAQGFTDDEVRIIGTELEQNNLEVAKRMEKYESKHIVSIIDTCKFILLMNDIKKEINKYQNEKINLTEVDLTKLSYKHLSKLLSLMTILYKRSLGHNGDDYNSYFQEDVLNFYGINESTIDNLEKNINDAKEAKIPETTQEITLDNISENISDDDIKKLLPSSMQDIDTTTIRNRIKELKGSNVYKSLDNDADKKLSILAVCLYDVAKKEGAMFIHDWLEKVSGLSEEQKLTISDIFYSLEIANPTRQAYELAYSRKNKNIFSLVKCLNAAISTKEAPLFSDIHALEEKFKFIEEMLAHIKEQVKLTPFPSGAYQYADIPQEVLCRNNKYISPEVLDKIEKITVPIVDLTVVEKLSEDKQKQVFKALGMGDGITWENFNFLVHGIRYIYDIQPIQQMHRSYKPNAVLCTSNYTHQNTHLYCGQGFILDSDQANILQAYAHDIGSENKKTRNKIPLYIDQYKEQKFDSYMANSNFHDRADYSELQASEIKVSAVFIKKNWFSFEDPLSLELIRFAQDNNLPIILMDVIANQ